MATAPTVIRSGEQAPAPTLAVLKDKNAKTYYHMTAGAKFFMPDGLEIQFHGGCYVTVDEAEIAELSKVADRPASMIYTKPESKNAVNAMALNAAQDAQQSA